MMTAAGGDTRPSSPTYSPVGAGAGAAAASNPDLYNKRQGAGSVVEAYPAGAASSSSSSSSPSSAAPANLGNGPSFTQLTVQELQAKGFKNKAPLSKFNGTNPTGSVVRQEFSTMAPLPLVCASLEAFGAVTGLQVVSGVAQKKILEGTRSVTFSPAHAAFYAPQAAGAGAGGAGAASPSAGSPAGAPSSPAASTGTSPVNSPAGPVDLASIPQENLLAAAAGFARPSGSSSSSAMEVDGSAGAGGGSSSSSSSDEAACMTESISDRSLTKPYRFMFTTPKEKIDNLEGRLQEMTEAILSGTAYDPSLADLLAPVGTISQDPILYIGRIVTSSDGGVQDAKINATSVLLEGSATEAALTSTYRVHLDLQDMPGWSLFPGQIVAVKGLNPTGDRMRVQAIYHGLPAAPTAMPAINRLAMADAASAKGSGPLRAWVVSGPYCLAHELEYTPLNDFLDEVTYAARDGEQPPNVIIMVGS
jgi:hypothetical protein